MNNKRASSWLSVLGILLGGLSLPQVIAAEESPGLEFLEFLGEWEAKDGAWLDPVDLLQAQELAMHEQGIEQQVKPELKSDVKTEDSTHD